MSISEFMQHMQGAWYIYLLGGVALGAVSWLHATYLKISACFRLVNELSKQFKTDSGSSIKDIIDRIEFKINLIEFMKFAHLDLIPTPVFLADEKGHYIWANKAYVALTGLSLAELVGSGWETSIFEDDKNRIKSEWYAACGELRPFCVQFRMYVNHQNTFTGSILQVKCEAYGKKGIGYFGYIRDYTDKLKLVK